MFSLTFFFVTVRDVGPKYVSKPGNFDGLIPVSEAVWGWNVPDRNDAWSPVWLLRIPFAKMSCSPFPDISFSCIPRYCQSVKSRPFHCQAFPFLSSVTKLSHDDHNHMALGPFGHDGLSHQPHLSSLPRNHRLQLPLLQDQRHLPKLLSSTQVL